MDALRDPFLPADSARSRWIVIFGVVLLLHAAILMWRIGWEPLSPAGPRKIELQTLAPEKLAAIKKQWSQTPKQLLLNKNPAAPDPTVAPPKDARYESDRNQRVEREQRARNTRVIPKQGQPIAPSMRQPFAPTPQSPPAAAQPRAQARPRLPNLQSIGVPFRLNQRTPEPQAAAPAAPPRRGEAEPGGDEYIREKIPEGGENLLNTQESVHYSFYSRLKLAIGPVWESNTREITYRRSIRPGEYSTVVDVVLDSDGELKEIHHLQGSGIPELDRVVDTSWHRINRFPNPPRALLDKSGELHMVWTFTVHIDEGSGIRYLPPERLD